MRACRLVGGASSGAEAQRRRLFVVIFSKSVLFETVAGDGNTWLLTSSKALAPVQLYDTFLYLVLFTVARLQ